MAEFNRPFCVDAHTRTHTQIPLIYVPPLTWEHAHRSRKQTMESFPLPPRTVGMIPGWSPLLSGVHASEDALKAAAADALSFPSSVPSRGGAHRLVAAPRRCCRRECVTEGDRGGDEGGPPTSEMTHSAAHARREITTPEHMWISQDLLFCPLPPMYTGVVGVFGSADTLNGEVSVWHHRSSSCVCWLYHYGHRGRCWAGNASVSRRLFLACCWQEEH